MTAYPIQLYVYDLSRGLAKSMSMQFLGTQIDGVWHTSVIYNGTEYYYGAGVQTSVPGQTHHGQPLEVVDMGETALPEEVVLEYIDSLKEIYTAEKYDLFMHNCNNFSQDLCQFLVGRDIPKRISGLPQEVLSTPFGRMLKPMIEQSLRPITTVPSMPQQQPPRRTPAPAPFAASTPTAHAVIHATSALQVETGVKSKLCAIVFFTSSTCAPCKIAYPKYDELAATYGDKCAFVKVDINFAYDVATRWHISATPTFMTFIKGDKFEEWKGASPPTLESNVNTLLQIAYPPHPHKLLSLPTLTGTSTRSIMYERVPPIDKILAKLSSAGITDISLTRLAAFIKERELHGPREAAIPDLHTFALFVQKLLKTNTTSGDELFPVIDLLRVAVLDVRVTSWFAEEPEWKTVRAIIQFTADDSKPYQVRLVTLQLMCNLFPNHLFVPHLVAEMGSDLAQLATNSLLDAHSNVRIAASSLAFNIAAYAQRVRTETGKEALLGTDVGIELVVALIEGISRETESGPTLSRLLTALGFMLYGAPADAAAEVQEICGSLNAYDAVKGKMGAAVADRRLCDEVMQLLARP
ncbi:PPPDE putative peptidase domain-containing protein [Limtongia smithiae]|uniref:PPPDE putative peptidase domain-containing protein n=1 Tax=Limtongia smithiae TaxID=1125753 RepID=UPI0034CFD246